MSFRVRLAASLFFAALLFATRSAQALVGFDCAMSEGTGYTSGQPTPITLVTVDGMAVELDTANAFLTMAHAAETDGIALHISSGFRTMAEQQYYYNCYINCNCNSCNLAASPGYSNHQSGHALDLNTADGGVYDWLNAHGSTYGFARTVPSEAWHWEWWGAGAASTPYCSKTCDRSAGGFTFSCDGTNAGQTCVNVDEPADPDGWSDNFFCSDAASGLAWSHSGPIAGMVCTNVTEAADPHAAAWSDDFLCVPPQSSFRFEWSSAGPIAGMACVQWNETSDPDSWNDNYLCSAPVSRFTSGPFTFSMSGPAPGHCVQVDEPSDPNTWNDNYFCSDADLGMKWSYAGAIDGMICTNVAEPADDHPAAWADNFLCLPPGSPYRFSWSSAGPIADKSCVRWYESADLAGSWNDNWLCYESTSALTPSAPGAGGAAAGNAGSSGSSSGDGSQGSGCSASRPRAPASSWPLALLVGLGLVRRRARPRLQGGGRAQRAPRL